MQLLTGISTLIKSTKEDRAFCSRARSRAYGLSLIIIPKACTACSTTLNDADLNSFTNFVIIPFFITYCASLENVFKVTAVNKDINSSCKTKLNKNKKIIPYILNIIFIIAQYTKKHFI